MRLGVLSGAPGVPGRAGLASRNGSIATFYRGAGRTPGSAPIVYEPQKDLAHGHHLRGCWVLCGASDPRRPDYSEKVAARAEFRGDGSGSVLNRALNKELQQCKSLDELSDTLNSSDVHLDAINIATAWVQLAKLRPFIQAPRGTYVPMAPAVAPLVRLLIGKTIATVHLMELRPLTNCLYGMGRLSVDLGAEPNGHYLAEQVEQRLLELAEARQGLAKGVDAAQLWYSLRAPRLYLWSASFTSRLVELSLRDMDDWDADAVGQVCLYWGRLSIQLAPAQKELFTQRVISTLEDMASGGEDSPGQHVMIAWVQGIRWLGLTPPAELLSSLHKRLLSLPESDLAKADGRVQYSTAASSLLQLGYQPTAEEAAAWEQRLLHPPPGARWRLSAQELTSGLATLSSMSAYVPSSEVLARATAYVRDPRGCTAADARCLLTVIQHWRLPCTQPQAEALKRLATPEGSVAQEFAEKRGSVHVRQRQQQQQSAAGASLPARDPRLRPPLPRPGQQGKDRR